MNRESKYFVFEREIPLGKTLAVLLAFLITAVNFGNLMTDIRNAPEVVYAETESELSDKLALGFSDHGLSITAERSSDQKLNPREVSLRYNGIISLRKIAACVEPRRSLVPGGQAVGISIYTDGVLVVGLSGFRSAEGISVDPAQKAGLKAGDVILAVNGESVSTADELRTLLASSSGSIRLLVDRAGSVFESVLTPEKSETGELRIGAWVRDSTVGVGTLTYYDPSDLTMAALGHAVTDADTGSLLKVKDGKLVIADIIGVTKGRAGAPGELHGTFSDGSYPLGEIDLNTELGIFGKLFPDAPRFLGGEALEVAFPDEVHTGDAYIITSAGGDLSIRSCRIIRTGKQNGPAPKGLVIEITDEALIGITGGIVQGMSGSPVIQDGRLVGVITHVLVNDPTKGYGAYAYWMFKRNGG